MNIHECQSYPNRKRPSPGNGHLRVPNGLAVLMCELRVNLQISPENTTDENPEVLFVVFDLFLVCVCVCFSEMHFLIHLENSLSLEWFVV